MLKLFRRTKFDKDLRLMQKRGKKIAKLWDLVELILREERLPLKNRNHKLSGDYTGCLECHIEPDWLLVYKADEKEVNLIRTGSHADLFE